MLVWFRTQSGNSIAVDDRHVTSVYESDVNDNKITNINTLNGNIQVVDSVLEVVSRLNNAE